MKNFIIIVVVIIIAGVGIYIFTKKSSDSVVVPTETATSTETSEVSDTEVDESKTVIGKSVEGRDITAYHYGSGAKEILFVGGIHGGYSWNTALVAYEMMNYLESNTDIIPSNVKVTVIPVLNPDGLNKVVGTDGVFAKADVSTSQTVRVSGRFNANEVDLNRNFDCDWQSVGMWQTTKVSGGSKAFSEPESLAIQGYVTAHNLEAVVVWYSSAGGVYASSCGGSISPETRTLTSTYAKASGYPQYDSFNYYPTTGDMVNWLAKNNIPAISVLLTTHEDTEWSKNKKGLEALLQYFAK